MSDEPKKLFKMSTAQKARIIAWLVEQHGAGNLQKMTMAQIATAAEKHVGYPVRNRVVRYLVDGCGYTYKNMRVRVDATPTVTQTKTPSAVVTYRPNGTAYLRIAKLETDFAAMARRCRELDDTVGELMGSIRAMAETNTRLEKTVTELMDAATRPEPEKPAPDTMDAETRAWLEKP